MSEQDQKVKPVVLYFQNRCVCKVLVGIKGKSVNRWYIVTKYFFSNQFHEFLSTKVSVDFNRLKASPDTLQFDENFFAKRKLCAVFAEFLTPVCLPILARSDIYKTQLALVNVSAVKTNSSFWVSNPERASFVISIF